MVAILPALKFNFAIRNKFFTNSQTRESILFTCAGAIFVSLFCINAGQLLLLITKGKSRCPGVGAAKGLKATEHDIETPHDM